MKVLVTGGTGFVGSHAVEAILRAGHEVRLLARTPEKVDRVLGARGVKLSNVVLGDMTDAACVRNALTGCDAALHAAAEVEIGRAKKVFEANVAGTHNVVGGAVELGLDPILVVSSVATMFPPAGPVIRVDDPVANLHTDYGRSKAEGERYARGLQAVGKPVVSIYPTGVVGPNDPGLSAPVRGVRDQIRFGSMITSGGVGLVDVRDVARIIVAALEPGRGPRRYMAGGGAIAPSFDFPITHEASLFMTLFVPSDSRATTEELGVTFRPTRETLVDTVRFLLETGELEPGQVPALFPAGPK